MERTHGLRYFLPLARKLDEYAMTRLPRSLFPVKTRLRENHGITGSPRKAQNEKLKPIDSLLTRKPVAIYN